MYFKYVFLPRPVNSFALPSCYFLQKNCNYMFEFVKVVRSRPGPTAPFSGHGVLLYYTLKGKIITWLR